eukprot:GDKH01003085.1.p1 GENE.GDKH01003085.1~~GDKH01003085.1.p1  ORF type:complete len:215 (-),score=13.56 GDKH01003085.1:372-1016(-)
MQVARQLCCCRRRKHGETTLKNPFLNQPKRGKMTDLNTTPAVVAATSSRDDSPDPTVSALRDSVAQKGENSYYYAHAKKIQVPEGAKVVEGPGLVTGGPPRLIERSVSTKSTGAGRWTAIKNYSWCDETATVRVYVPLDQLPAGVASEDVSCEFLEKSATLRVVTSSGPQLLKMDSLYGEIVPEASTFRLTKTKITLTMKKKSEYSWFQLGSQK